LVGAIALQVWSGFWIKNCFENKNLIRSSLRPWRKQKPLWSNFCKIGNQSCEKIAPSQKMRVADCISQNKNRSGKPVAMPRIAIFATLKNDLKS